MRLYAIISDIHSNYQALKAVEKDALYIAQSEEADELRFICLGDVVDYGPQPNECMAWVRRKASLVVRGNHDRVAIEPLYTPPFSIDEDYWPITLWTRTVLDEGHKRAIAGWSPSKNLNKATGKYLDLKEFYLFHGSLVTGEEDGRIDDVWDAEKNLEKLQSSGVRYGLFGHTHHQGFFLDEIIKVCHILASSETGKVDCESDGWETIEIGRWMPLPDSGCRALFNPGSVGQPRMHSLLKRIKAPFDYRAEYMLLRSEDKGERFFQFRRVDYAVEETISYLRKVKWPKEQRKPERGRNIYRDRDPNRDKLLAQSQVERLRKIMGNDELLAQLIEEVLIPTLIGGE